MGKEQNRKEGLKSLYFSHPIVTYRTEPEIQALLYLEEKYNVLNPANIIVPSIAPFTCSKCMDLVMRSIYFPSIARCDVFGILSSINSCTSRCELNHAFYIGKPCVFIVPTQVDEDEWEVDIEPITLQEYNYMEF